MASLNKVMLIGNVGRDPEMRYTANGTAQTSFSLAVNRAYRDPGGSEWKEETEWFNIVVWAERAERIAQSVTKGKQVYIEGRFQTRSWDDDQGVKHYRTEVIANDVKLLGPRDPASGGGNSEWGDGSASYGNRGPAARGAAPARGGFTRGGGSAAGAPGGGDIDPDDLPFE
jgi:single-strand DNA-binding protein